MAGYVDETRRENLILGPSKDASTARPATMQSPSMYDEENMRARSPRGLRENGRYGLLLAERDGEAIGMLIGFCDTFLFSSARAATVYTWYVKLDFRGGLAAIKLLHAFRRWARAAGAEAIFVNVTGGVQVAQTDKLLKRLGFRCVGGNYVTALRLPDVNG